MHAATSHRHFILNGTWPIRCKDDMRKQNTETSAAKRLMCTCVSRWGATTSSTLAWPARRLIPAGHGLRFRPSSLSVFCCRQRSTKQWRARLPWIPRTRKVRRFLCCIAFAMPRSPFISVSLTSHPPPPLPRRIAGCLTPGASFANLMAVVAARHKHFPHIRQKGLQPVSKHRAERVNF